jgi:hypothetical protein
MCEISGEIKFCTCSRATVKTLKNYWKLYRYSISQLDVLGLVLYSNELAVDNFPLNRDRILKRLNDKDAFDQPMHFMENDRMQIVIEGSGEKGNDVPFSYNFIFNEGEWKYQQTSPFELENDYLLHKTGRIDNI